MDVDMHQLTSLATNDVATGDIQHDMLTAQQRGQQMVLEDIAKVNGTLNSTTKSDLVNILMDGETIPHTIPAPTMHQNTCVLIDGHALVQALGKPQTCRTFDDYARVFFRAVTAHIDEHVRRVDVVFDTYVKQSIKSATRAKRGIKKRPVRKIINRGDLSLPQVWANFVALSDNKADLARFLSEYIMSHGREFSHQYELVTSGGYMDQLRHAQHKEFAILLDIKVMMKSYPDE
ncbi:Hypothetical predicted protein [Paramuricea clavata]|uniref:Uncharacterized protein n=1 Tax=Paramuricea clavata TaxID=317549 RepID=A0A6S7GP15_PARCT|nr:Hypothetical predicted protein [Paramuricea clavata]